MHATGVRSYNPHLGHWINRDPIGEKGGVNLMGFCGNYVTGDYDLLGLSWPAIMLKCGLEAYKKVLSDKFAKQLKRLDLCKKVAADMQSRFMHSDSNATYSFELDRPPLKFDIDNWAQVALGCVLNVVKKAGGVDKFLDSIDDASKRKLAEKLMELGEGKLSSLLEGKTPKLKYSISYTCISKTSAECQLNTSLSINLDGEVLDLPFTAKEDNDIWKCNASKGIAKWSGNIANHCSCYSNNPTK